VYSFAGGAARIRWPILGLLLPAALVLAACGSDSPEAGTDLDLEGSAWTLSSLVTDGSQAPAVGESTLLFAPGGEVAGSTGCNRFTGRWQQDGSELTITVGATTLAACASPELNEQEQQLIEALGGTAAVRQSGDSLELLDDQRDVLLVYQASLSELTGTAWQATGVNNQTGGVESTALTSSVTADFADDGTVSGSSGCREYRGVYEAADGSLSVTDISLQGTECSGDEAALEASYVAALQNTSTYTIEGSTLHLRDGEGATQVNYSLRP
jgi:heat shock protein HslJ